MLSRVSCENETAQRNTKMHPKPFGVANYNVVHTAVQQRLSPNSCKHMIGNVNFVLPKAPILSCVVRCRFHVLLVISQCQKTAQDRTTRVKLETVLDRGFQFFFFISVPEHNYLFRFLCTVLLTDIIHGEREYINTWAKI